MLDVVVGDLQACQQDVTTPPEQALFDRLRGALSPPTGMEDSCLAA
jgi:hypothetical protein